MWPPNIVIERAVGAAAGHQRHGGQHRHGGLADADHVRVAAADVADELLDVGHVVIQMERAHLGRHHACVGPVGDVDLVVLQQALHGVAQQRAVVARQRRHDQHRGLRLHQLQRGGVVAEALEAQQAAEGLAHRHLFLHGHVGAADQGRSDAEGRLLVLLGQAVQQVEARRHALRQWGVRKGRERVVVQLGAGAGELRERRHQGALGLVEVIEHEEHPSGVVRAG
jgi:hypothetical protein